MRREPFFRLARILTVTCSCEAAPGNLDNPNVNMRCHDKTDFLIRQFDPGIIWDFYGIRSDVIVSVWDFFCMFELAKQGLAIHLSFSPSGYPQALITGSPSSVS